MKLSMLNAVITAMEKWIRNSIFCLCVVAVMTCIPCVRAGSLSGKVRNAETGIGVQQAVVRLYASGRSAARSALSENDGAFSFTDLDSGTYSLCVTSEQCYRPCVLTGVQIRDGVEVRLDLYRSLAICGDSWLQGAPEFTQSFRATGLGITGIGIKAFGPARRIRVDVLDANGTVLGPSRITRRVGGEATEYVSWSGIEQPTIPGENYTIRLSAAGGGNIVPAVAGAGDVYPLGTATFNGSPRPHSDLGITLCEDNDQFRTSYALNGAGRFHRAVSAGQIFTAVSENITFASARLQSVGTTAYVRFSVHEGGPAGSQIGPSKMVQAALDVAVAWGPDEVPVTPADSYYLHMEALDGDVFLIAATEDACPNTQAVFNGRIDAEWDIQACVVGQAGGNDFARLYAHPQGAGVVELANPSFEQGLQGWRMSNPVGTVVATEHGVHPPWGCRMFGWTHRQMGQDSRTIIFQTVDVEKGARYSFSGSVYTDHVGGRSSDVKVRLVIGTSGGIDLQENAAIESSQWYATEGRWRRGSVEFVAPTRRITLGFDLEQRFSLPVSSLYVDAADLVRLRSP
ncbi:MAG: carboxypeptidase regulatory-like domain-containing protein [Sedimentisphaerales bacterium]|nr:carboxypeptidase regulatory-like domain-containing protein [Sedimentisphaerales bacterium]